MGVTLAHLVDTLKPGAHFGPLCSWNARLCCILLSKEMTKYKPSKLSARQKISDGTSFWPKNSDRNYVVGPRIISFTMGKPMIVVSMVTLSHSGVTWGHLGPTLGHFEHTLCHLGVHLGVTLGNVGVTLKPGLTLGRSVAGMLGFATLF